jgi:hypothetical protein
VSLRTSCGADPSHTIWRRIWCDASLVKAARTVILPANRGKRNSCNFLLHVPATPCNMPTRVCCRWTRRAQTTNLSCWLRDYASGIAHRHIVATAVSWNECTFVGCCSGISLCRLSRSKTSLSASTVLQVNVVVRAGILMRAFCNRDIALLQTSKAHAAWLCEAAIAQSLLKIREAETSMHEDSTECSENLVTPLDDVLESQMKDLTLN